MYYRIFSKIYEAGAKIMCQDCKDFIKTGSKILDLGCGSGIIAKNFQDFFKAETVGVDIEDHRMVDLPFKIINGEDLPFEDNSFDTTLISYVLHHSDDLERLLEEARRVSKKIIVYEDLPEGFFPKLRCYLHQLTWFGGKRKNFYFKTRDEWKELFKKLGLKVIIEKKVSSTLDWIDPVKRILFVLERA